MPDSLIRILVHIVFSTKGRTPWLEDEALRVQLFAYLADACEVQGWMPIIVGGHVDHVHILCCLSSTTPLSDFVHDIKRTSSRWVRKQGISEFTWQEGYGAFSVSEKHRPVLTEYIKNQAHHHGTMTFEDEFKKILKSAPQPPITPDGV